MPPSRVGHEIDVLSGQYSFSGPEKHREVRTSWRRPYPSPEHHGYAQYREESNGYESEQLFMLEQKIHNEVEKICGRKYIFPKNVHLEIILSHFRTNGDFYRLSYKL